MNKVQTCKKAIFLFEMLGSNGHKHAEDFYYLENKSQHDMMNWSDF